MISAFDALAEQHAAELAEVKAENGALRAQRDELLSALKACEDLLTELEQGGAENPELQIARDAIAKATQN